MPKISWIHSAISTKHRLAMDRQAPGHSIYYVMHVLHMLVPQQNIYNSLFDEMQQKIVLFKPRLNNSCKF